MRIDHFLIIVLSLALAGCGVDSRWGERRPTNPGLQGARGVDARWGPPRTGLREPLSWQYRSEDSDLEEQRGAGTPKK